MKNFTSFKDEAVFSMVSSENLTEKLCKNRVEIDKDFHLLKVASIFGANASGKSNLLIALNFVKRFMKNSMRDFGGIDTELTFLLDDVSKNNPTEFELSFLMSEKVITYSFSLQNGRVISEHLYCDELLVFKREKDKIIRYSTDFFNVKEEMDLKFSLTNSDSLFLTVLAMTNTKLAKEILDYVSKNIRFFSGHEGNRAYCTKKIIKEGKNGKAKILDLLKVADFSITNLDVKQHEFEVRTPNGIPEELIERAKKDAQDEANRLKSEHNIYDSNGNVIGNKLFDVEKFESRGTGVFLSLAGPIVETIENSGVLVIDEVDASLHPLVTKYLIDLFNSNSNKGAQLIITSHNPSILDKNLLRKDQIWFVEKDELEVSHLTALSEYKFNEAETPKKYTEKYLRGNFGAIPYIKNNDSYGNLVRKLRG